MPSIEHICYLVGFFDGDGCITTAPTKSFRIGIANTDKKVLNKLKRRFGGYINVSYVPTNKNHNMAWKWIITKRVDVLKTLKMIEPHLIIKKKQARIVIKYLDDIKPERYDKLKIKLRNLKSDKHYFRGGE